MHIRPSFLEILSLRMGRLKVFFSFFGNTVVCLLRNDVYIGIVVHTY